MQFNLSNQFSHLNKPSSYSQHNQRMILKTIEGKASCRSIRKDMMPIPLKFIKIAK